VYEEALAHWGLSRQKQTNLSYDDSFIVKSQLKGDQKVFVHLMITVQKTRKNILNIFNHLP
jgi:hypothetical protein